jgi:hypothetical protein
MSDTDQYYSSEGYTEDGPQEYAGAAVEMQPVPVYSLTENYAPEFGSCMTWPIGQAGINQPTQVLPRRTRRAQAKVILAALTGATAVVFNSKQEQLMGTNPQGIIVTVVGRFPDWENQQPLYAIAIGGTATVTTLDETYMER